MGKRGIVNLIEQDFWAMAGWLAVCITEVGWNRKGSVAATDRCTVAEAGVSRG